MEGKTPAGRSMRKKLFEKENPILCVCVHLRLAREKTATGDIVRREVRSGVPLNF